MSIDEQTILTLDEFLALPETKPATEFWNAQPKEKPTPTTKHSIIQTKLAAKLDAAAETKQPRLGRAMSELRCTFAGKSIVPDISYVRRERLLLDPDGRVADRFLAAPDLAVEIVSPEQSQFELVEKLAWCVHNGVSLAWLIDPDSEDVMVFSPINIPRVVPRDGSLEGGEVLPGFRCSVTELFGWLRE